VANKRRDPPLVLLPSSGSGSASFTWSSFLVAFCSAIVAGIAVQRLDGILGWGVAGVVALLGGAATAAGGSGRSAGVARARQVLASLEGGEAMPALERDPGDWGALYRRMNELSEQQRTSASAIAELERVRRQVETAATLLREGKDPLTEAPELRVGPLRELLEASRERPATAVVSRLPLGEEDLIGLTGDRLSETWPSAQTEPAQAAPVQSWPAQAGAAQGDPRFRADVLHGIDELILGLDALAESMASQSAGTGPDGSNGGPRTPAQLVDAVVHTAADGIEDLAAGLMRASELASVAERLTNRATLLALNAALEATRSGSEAFAAIAEETRRLAEFAREATDTISRLASEIEYKVGETITAIHATSEDAKSAVAALSGGITAPIAPPRDRRAVDSLRRRARSLRAELTAAAGVGSHPAEDSTAGDSGDAGDAADEPAPMELAPRFDAGPSSGLSHDLAPNPSSATRHDEPPQDYMHLLDRLKPGKGTPS